MKKLNLYNRCLLLFVLCLGGLCACQSEAAWLDSETQEEGLEITVEIPGYDIPVAATRALEAKEENQLDHVDVFVFRASDDKYVSHHSAAKITHQDILQEKARFKIPDVKDKDAYYLMIIANAKEEVASLANAFPYRTYNEIAPMLTMAFSGQWPANLNNDGIWKPIPMWGKSDVFTTTKVGPIPLKRALAKIDVVTNWSNDAEHTPDGCETFDIQEIHVFNSWNNIALAPGATEPNLPAGTASTEYMLNVTNETTQKQLYVPEQNAGSLDTRSSHFYLVIKAHYKPETSVGGTEGDYYYRIDLLNPIEEDGIVTGLDFLPVLRNHQYRLNIEAVYNAGYGSLSEAKEALGLNSNMQIDLVCEDDRFNNIFYDGYYYIKADRKCIYRNATKDLVIDMPLLMNEAGKVSIEYLYSSSGWLKIDKTDLPRGLNNLRVTMSANTSTTTPREAILHIKMKGIDAKFPILQFQQGQEIINFNPPVTKYWLVGRTLGTGIPIGKTNTIMNGKTQPKEVARNVAGIPVDWEASVSKDLGSHVDRIITRRSIGGDYEGDFNMEMGNGAPSAAKVFRIDLRNKWEATQSSENAKFDIEIRAIDDPTCVFTRTFNVYGAAKVGNFYITPFTPMNGVDAKFGATGNSPVDHNWTNMNNRCQNLNAFLGKTWRLPTQSEYKIIFETYLKQASYRDELINLMYTRTNTANGFYYTELDPEISWNADIDVISRTDNNPPSGFVRLWTSQVINNRYLYSRLVYQYLPSPSVKIINDDTTSGNYNNYPTFCIIDAP